MTFPILASLLVRLVVLYHFNYSGYRWRLLRDGRRWRSPSFSIRSEERFSRNAETDLVCRLLLEKKNNGYIARLTESIHGMSKVVGDTDRSATEAGRDLDTIP